MTIILHDDKGRLNLYLMKPEPKTNNPMGHVTCYFLKHKSRPESRVTTKENLREDPND